MAALDGVYNIFLILGFCLSPGGAARHIYSDAGRRHTLMCFLYCNLYVLRDKVLRFCLNLLDREMGIREKEKAWKVTVSQYIAVTLVA